MGCWNSVHCNLSLANMKLMIFLEEGQVSVATVVRKALMWATSCPLWWIIGALCVPLSFSQKSAPPAVFLSVFTWLCICWAVSFLSVHVLIHLSSHLLLVSLSCSPPFYLKDLFVYLKDRVTERQGVRQKERDILPPAGSLPNGSNDQDWVRQKLGA